MTYRGYKINHDPIPLISFSLGSPSTLFSILFTHQHHPFNVHLLNSSDQSIWKTIVLVEDLEFNEPNQVKS
ncbi:hypothetical protein DFH28DRAFT_969882 [Melampsora americana]|nr:hypothetical protein DFH28DRAFT_969882 [Melampsora americana]